MNAPAKLLFSGLALVLTLLQACSSPPRKLLSVAISPASGTAQGSPGQMQFVATGTYNTAPYTVTPLTASWGVENPSTGAIAATTETGLATCKAAGKVNVEAWVQLEAPVCDVIDSAGRPGCGNVGGTAQLTCP